MTWSTHLSNLAGVASHVKGFVCLYQTITKFFVLN